MEKTLPFSIVAYTTFTGDYKNVWPTMNALYTALSGAGVTSHTGIGIYYDDPAAVSGTLKSDIGSIIAQSDFPKLNKKSPDYSLKVVEGGDKVVIEFPYKNSLSYIIGPMKVYPVMNKYLEEKWYKTDLPRIELYDISAKKIYYMIDIVK